MENKMATKNIPERGADTMENTSLPPCAIRVMSPLAIPISFPGLADATPDAGSFKTFEYRATVKDFLRMRPKA